MNKTVLITGASGGIGYELTKLFARDKYNLILVSRDEEKLNKVAEEIKKDHKLKVEIIARDLSLENSASEIFLELKNKNIQVDVLINNAGFGVSGDFKDTLLEKEVSMIKVNILALTQMAKLFLRQLNNSSGKILNVASTGGFQPGPGMAIYCATKAYVLSFSEAISEELKNKKVSITALCPGPTKTGFARESNMAGSKMFSKTMSAKKVAEIGYRALQKNKPVVITGFKYKFLIFLERLVPRCVVRKIMKSMLKKSA